MPHVEKVKKVLEALGYKPEDVLLFTLRRFEKLSRNNVSLEAKDDKELKEKFHLFAERHKMKVIGEYSSLNGSMELKELIHFLREYDEKFDLNLCEIDFKELIIRPMYL